MSRPVFASLALRVLSRAVIVAGLALPAAATLLTAESAYALCKQGGPNCAPPWNKLPSAKIPNDCWYDPHYRC